MRPYSLKLKKYAAAVFCLAAGRLRGEARAPLPRRIRRLFGPFWRMLVLYVVFREVIGRDQPFYAAFVLIGTLVWEFSRQCLLYDAQAVRENRNVLRGSDLPACALVLSDMLMHALKILPSALLLLPVLYLQGASPAPVAWFALPLLLLLWLLVCGAGLVLLPLGFFHSGLQEMLQAGLQLFFYFTGIFYDLRALLPGAWGVWLARLNPLAAVLQGLRDCILYGRPPEAGTMVGWLAAGVILCGIGIRLNRRLESTYRKFA